MTTPEAIALHNNAIVRHASGKLYRVLRVATQAVIIGAGRPAQFVGAPFPARLQVVGRRGGRDFGPARTVLASDCTLVDPPSEAVNS